MDLPRGRWRYVLGAWITFALLLFLAGLVFLVFGAHYRRGGLWLFATGALSLMVAVPTIAIFLWYVFCRKEPHHQHRDENHYYDSTEGPISYIGGPHGNQQRSLSEAELKSDFPMGPLLIMTLPKPRKSAERLDNAGTTVIANDPDDVTSEPTSVDSTPDILAKRHKMLSKNLPPLASEETLTPSLKSSMMSLNSAI